MNINYSIIIPHYDIPDLLMRCLKSIPIREDVQVIVVDDCSPGADRYKEQYPELSRPYLEFYSTPIEGSAGRARNVGLEHAKGKWIIFADADDYFTPCFDIILDEYVDSDKDMVIFYPDARKENTWEKSRRTLFIHSMLNDYLETKDDSSIRFQQPTVWSRFILHSVIKEHDIRFQEIFVGNDVLFSAQLGYYVKSIEVDLRTIYVVIRRERSLVTKRSEEQLAIRFSAQLAKYNFLKGHGINISNPIVPFCRTWIVSISMYSSLRHVAIANGMKGYEFDRNFGKFLIEKIKLQMSRFI